MAIEYKLKKPITIGEEIVSVMQFEEPELRKLTKCKVDLSEAALKTAGGMMALLEACAVGDCENYVCRMKASDMAGAAEICSGFFS